MAMVVSRQALVPTIVAKREGILNEDLYNAPRNGLPFTEDLDDESVEPEVTSAR